MKLGHADIRMTQGYLRMSADRSGGMQRAHSPVDRLGLAVERADTPPVPQPRGQQQQKPPPYYRQHPKHGDR